MLQEKSKSAANARREYLKEWRRKNPKKVSEYNERYWLKRAAKEREDQDVKSKEPE